MCDICQKKVLETPLQPTIYLFVILRFSQVYTCVSLSIKSRKYFKNILREHLRKFADDITYLIDINTVRENR